MADSIIYEDFSSPDLITHPVSGDALIYSQYEGSPNQDPGEEEIGTESITTLDQFVGERSFRIKLEGGAVYGDHRTKDIGNNESYYTRELAIENGHTWNIDTLNRIRFFIKPPVGMQISTTGQEDFYVGTYARRTDDNRVSDESDNGHWYHFYNPQIEDKWNICIWDFHPNTRRGASGNVEQGIIERPFPDEPNPLMNYLDLLTRFYFRSRGILSSGYPANWFIDHITIYEDDIETEIALDTVYSLTGGYDDVTNTFGVSWRRNKDEQGDHEVRWFPTSIHTQGWANANSTSGNIISPLSSGGGYNAMIYSTTEIDADGADYIYFAIKPLANADADFREIPVPVTNTLPPLPA